MGCFREASFFIPFKGAQMESLSVLWTSGLRGDHIEVQKRGDISWEYYMQILGEVDGPDSGSSTSTIGLH